MPPIATHFPKAKVICCVRSISWIMDSFERLTQNNAVELSGISASMLAEPSIRGSIA
jgi:sulfotransferase